MDLKSLSLSKTREILLSSENFREQLNELPDELILDLLKVPRFLNSLLKTFRKAKLYYEIDEEENLIDFWFFEDETNFTMPFVEVEVSLHIVDSERNICFEYSRKEDGTVDLSSIRQSFDPEREEDSL